MTRFNPIQLATAALLVFAVGCGKSETKHEAPAVHDHSSHDHGSETHDDAKDPFASLGAEDAKLAKAQATCPVSDEQLGDMGAPIKVMVGDKPVFICCSSCKKNLLADPDKYLAKLK